MNQLLFADDKELVDDPEQELCRLVVEFGRVNVGKSKVTSYVNLGRVHVRLNGEPLQEVDCYKYVGS